MALFCGVSFDPAETNATYASRIFPVHMFGYKMVQSDGREMFFKVTDPAAGQLAGPEPWIGQKHKQQGHNIIDIWAKPAREGAEIRAGMTFVDGRLQIKSLDGNAYSLPKEQFKLTGSVASLFPERKARETEKGSSGDIWGDKRLRLWFVNPNSAGFLFTELVLIAFAVFLRLRKGWKVIPALIGIAAFAGLMATASRGALLALLVGLGVLSAPYFRVLKKPRVLAFSVVGLLIFVGIIFFSGQLGRLAGTFTSIDGGNLLRLRVAKASLQMFADAPWGWQGGEVPARNAALNWYLFGDSQAIRTHLLTLTELGWGGGCCWLFGWFFSLCVGFRLVRRGRLLPLAVMLAFFVAGCLNPVYTEVSLWILPIAVWVWSLKDELSAGRSLIKCGYIAAISAVAAVVALVLIGWTYPRETSVQIRSSGKAAVINGADPKVWLVEDAKALGGSGFPGREILSYYVLNPESPALAYVYEVQDLPDEVDKLVLVGRAAAEFLAAARETGSLPCRAKRYLFLSPTAGPADLEAVAPLFEGSEYGWVTGYFAALRDEAYRVHRPWVTVVAGCELYLWNWVGLALR